MFLFKMKANIVFFFMLLQIVIFGSCTMDTDDPPLGPVDPVYGPLQVHMINVQWGNSILVVGPDKTSVLIDGGTALAGLADVIPYLHEHEIPQTLDFMIVTHRHGDHYQGLINILNNGFDAREIYDNGSDSVELYDQLFIDAVNRSSAQGLKTMPLGMVIDLGNQAKLTCVAANGVVLGIGRVKEARYENDLSICLLLQYGNFDFLLMADAGGGFEPEIGHYRRTADIETRLIKSLISGQGQEYIPENGVEVLQVGHHGDQGSTNSFFMNKLQPIIACISVGKYLPEGWDLPMKSVVENVLQANHNRITASPALVLQTDEGEDRPQTSYAGYCVGDIVIQTDGVKEFEVKASGRVSNGNDERDAAGLPCVFPLKKLGNNQTIGGNI